jgi:hypothetical protein
MSIDPRTLERVQLKVLMHQGEEVLSELEEAGVFGSEPSEQELAAIEARDYLRYNVAMTGRIPLLDEQRGLD